MSKSQELIFQMKRNFSTTKPDENVDDQKSIIIVEEMHTMKDYAKYVQYAFPLINSTVAEAIKTGDGKHWTNKTLSYMRKNGISQKLLDEFYPEVLPFDKFNLLDATANIGGDTIQYALRGHEVLAFEMQKNVYDMLQNNVALYNLQNLVTTHHARFEYTKCAEYISKFKTKLPVVVIIDPPFEINNNSDHFNLSIARIPIYYIVEYLLEHCCEAVILSMPNEFKYNLQYAKEHKHVFDICYIKNKGLKMLVVQKGDAFSIRVYCISGGEHAKLVKCPL